MNESQSDNIAQPAGGSDNGPSAQARESGWLARLKASLGLVSDRSLRASLETALEQPERLSTAFSPEERLMLLNILGFRELRVEDVMVPRADIIACEENVLISDLMKLFHTAGHSRIPVYRAVVDDPRGMVHIKDLMGWITGRAANGRRRAAPASAAKPGGAARGGARPPKRAKLDFERVDVTRTLGEARIVRPVLFVPPSMPAVDLLVKMQSTRVHLALVVDEYGGTDGLVSIEDLVEEIVGDIEDEHDPANAPRIERNEDGDYIADARLPIEDFSALIGRDPALCAYDEDIDTLGGLVFTLLGRVPARGEVVTDPGGLEFEVLDADPRRIKKLKVVVRRPGAAESRAPVGEGEGK